MKFSTTLLAGAAALALIGCGGKDGADAPKTEASAAAAKTEAGSPLEKKFTLKGASEFDIDKLLALAPEKARPTYEKASFDAKLGATVVEGLRFADADDGQGVVVERAEFYGVDEEAIDRIRNSGATGIDAPFETVFQKVRLLNVQSEGLSDPDGGEEVDLTIGGVEFDKLAIRQGGPEGNPDGNDAANFFNAVNLGGLYFKDFALSAVGDANEKVKVNAPDLRLVGMAGGKINAVIAKDTAIDVVQSPEMIEETKQALGPAGAALYSGPLAAFLSVKSQQAEIGLFEWRDIDFSGALEYGLKDEEPPVTDHDLMDFGSIAMSDVVSSVDGREASRIKKVDISKMKFAWMIPSAFRMDIDGATADYTAYLPDKEDPAYAVMKDHGLDNITGDGFAEWKWNPDNGDGGLDYDVRSKGFADLALSFDMAGATLDEIAEAQDVGDDKAFANNAKMKAFNLKLKDEKALDAIFAIAALQMGGTGDDLRQSTPAMIRLSGAQFAQINPRISDYVDALAAFIAEGGTLEVDAKPENPVGAGDFASGAMNPATAPDDLNLTITHKK